MLPPLLSTLGFKCNNTAYRPVTDVLALLEKYADVAETSILALHLLRSSLVHINTLLLQQVLAEPKWAKKLTAEDRRGLTALFWSNVNPYGTFRLDMNKRLELGLPTAVPRPRTPADTAARTTTETR
ncbi:Tn3 family transposase [Streptomyces sp. NPDC057545]|uniref:Tn3 family transposase n=1 Tax=Streptomyces sp. NPDC057545 TaxID=3346164 RepID=UPI00369EC55D